MKKQKGKSKNSGYTLLFAMIVASIVLALGVSLLTTSRKEFALTSSAGQSSSALYAADGAIACAEYWDTNTTAFSTTSPSPSAITCSYNDAMASPSQITHAVTVSSCVAGSDCVFTFFTPFSTDGVTNLSCAAVTVDKNYATTTIISRGYNIGWDSGNGTCDTVSPKKVERAIQLTY